MLVEIEKKNAVAIIRLNSPDNLNALGTGMLDALGSALRRLESDETIRAVIITGEKVFCAGADLKELKDKSVEEASAYARAVNHTFSLIENSGLPVIAAVNGYALGGGCELAMACDIRIASEDAKFGQPEINVGLIPASGGTQILQRLIGIGKAKELIMTGRIIGAAEAEAIGLVDKVVNEGALMAASEEIAGLLSQKSPALLKIIKDLINESFKIKRGNETENLAFTECFALEEYKEGIAAFLEKRKPRF